MPNHSALSLFIRLFVIFAFALGMICGKALAQDGADQSLPVEITVGIPSTPEDQVFLQAINPPPVVPLMIHIKNVSAQEVTIPGFDKLVAPIALGAKTKWMGPPVTPATAAPHDLAINPGDTVVAYRDLNSLTSFYLFGTYPLGYTFHASYTYYHVKPSDSPGSYATHPIDINGALDLPISISQSTYGWYALIGPALLVLLVFAIVIFHYLTRVPAPKASWTADFSVSDHDS